MLRLGQAREPELQPHVQLEAVKPRASRPKDMTSNLYDKNVKGNVVIISSDAQRNYLNFYLIISVKHFVVYLT